MTVTEAGTIGRLRKKGSLVLMAKNVPLSGPITPAPIYHPATAGRDGPAADVPPLPPSLVAPARFSSLADWEKVFFLGVSPVCQKSPPGGIAQSEIPRELERSNTELQTQIQTAFWEEVCQDVRRLIRRPAGVKGQGQSHPLTTIIWSFTNAGRSGRHRHAML